MSAPEQEVTAHLADVLPTVAAAMGVCVPTGRPPVLALPTVNRVVVLLCDGMGDLLLEERRSHAPFLNGLRRPGPQVLAGHPSTTATSMGSFGTGLLPGAHGMVGWQVMDPGTGRLFNELSWEDGPDPHRWQPHPTVFEQLTADGAEVFHIGPSFFEGSGLTASALRGPTFVSALSLSERVELAVSLLRQSQRVLVYLYWGDVDKVGHERGVASQAWLAELEAADLAARTLAARLPQDAMLVVTADHGMVDIPRANRVDIGAPDPLARALGQGVRLMGGEPRAPMLYTEPGRAHAVRDRWAAEFGDDAVVLLRDEAIAAGWFGPVREQVLPRIGDVLVAFTAERTVYDSRVLPPRLADLIGMHGSITEVERRIPFLVHGPRLD